MVFAGVWLAFSLLMYPFIQVVEVRSFRHSPPLRLLMTLVAPLWVPGVLLAMWLIMNNVAIAVSPRLWRR